MFLMPKTNNTFQNVFVLSTALVRDYRICNGCEVRIENFVTRVTVQYHEACRVMVNSYPKWQCFQFAAKSIMDSFSCRRFL